jgi:hypothetical protein
MIEIRLTTDEILAGVVVAANKKITSDRRRAEGRASRSPEHYQERNGVYNTWDNEIESALAEIAVSRWRNRYWMGMYVSGGAGTDAGNAQVRWTERHDGHLILYKEDNDDAVFVLVTGRSPDFRIVGWAKKGEVIEADFWHEPPAVKCASWWIPQPKLWVIK